jgi:hypothetical protein
MYSLNKSAGHNILGVILEYVTHKHTFKGCSISVSICFLGNVCTHADNLVS